MLSQGLAHYYWPQGHNLNKLDRGLLVDATYKILRLQTLWFHKVFISKIYFNLCDLDMQHTGTI